MESQDRRRLAARFPGAFPAIRLPGTTLGNLGEFTGKSPQSEGAIAGFEIFPAPMISFYDQNKTIPPTIRPYCPNRVLLQLISVYLPESNKQPIPYGWIGCPPITHWSPATWRY